MTGAAWVAVCVDGVRVEGTAAVKAESAYAEREAGWIKEYEGKVSTREWGQGRGYLLGSYDMDDEWLDPRNKGEVAEEKKEMEAVGSGSWVEPGQPSNDQTWDEEVWACRECGRQDYGIDTRRWVDDAGCLAGGYCVHCRSIREMVWAGLDDVETGDEPEKVKVEI